MSYRSLRECTDDLAHAGQLVRIAAEVDPHLEIAEIQRRVYQAQGPALLFERVKGCPFPVVCNLFGTRERVHFMFRHTLANVRRLFELKIDPSQAARHPWRYWNVPWIGLKMLPRRVRRGPVMEGRTTIGALPQIQSWPDDGGAFITLPQVYTEDPACPGVMHSNLGMYRIQLSGGQYQANAEIGMHYQIHRGIGVHHAAAVRLGQRLRVNVFVGGPPALTVAAVMPLPEGLSELSFAGALGGRRVRMIHSPDHLPIHADADFCLVGSIDPDRLLPEGPFGDHLGYYSLAHDFPVMRVDQVYHRRDAIWPFTVVGRPPQEDTQFGELIHELTAPLIPTVIPGVRAVHAVDAAGVHPLLLAIGSERYVPYRPRTHPQELLTQANAILGQGQMSLAKYLLIVAGEDQPDLDLHDLPRFFRHWLQRIDFTRDLHFQTCTTIDTLDYSGSGFNQGSKLVAAAVGPPRFDLADTWTAASDLPPGLSQPRLCLPGIFAVQADSAPEETDQRQKQVRRWCEQLEALAPSGVRLLVLVDDSAFTAQSERNFLWVTFTRSNPAADVFGVQEFIDQKHWGCRGTLLIDARLKRHHAPPLLEDPAVTRRVDVLAVRGGPLYGIL
jgi:4-hydroxy-3-polyprenylbenzoate decarboxylase